jgi:hypothetical protein
MTYSEYLALPQSKKIVLVEADIPRLEVWINYQPGIWFTTITPGNALVTDDRGNTGYWGKQNTQYYNIGSFNVAGELYPEVASIVLCISTEKSWFYDTATTKMYVHFEDWLTPEPFTTVAPGAVIGFTDQIDNTVNNYFEDVYYEPLINSVPNFSKKKDALFFGILQYQGGSISFDNTGGYFDDFATLDLYGQPIRVFLTFEGLAYSSAELIYSGRIEDFAHDFNTFKLNVADKRKLLSRKYPINVFDAATYPDMDEKLLGVPIPITFGMVEKAPAYRTSAGNWKFADTTFNAIDANIVVYNKDDTLFSHGGTETDGTFTGADTTDKLTVTFIQSAVENGLDTISDLLENYEGIDFNGTNYDTTEWNAEKAGISNTGLWLGRGNLKASDDIIEQICTDNQGIFDVLAAGKFTYRSFDEDRASATTIQQDELLDDPDIIYDSKEYLSSAKIEYSEDLKEKDPEIYTNTDNEAEVYGRYRQYKERTFKTKLTNEADAITLSQAIMEQSKFIFPIINVTTKTQNIGLRILDNITFTYKRQNGSVIIPEALYQVLGINLDLSGFEVNVTLKYIKDV